MLRHEFQELNLQTPIVDLDIYNDGLIVLEAVGSSDTGRYHTRQSMPSVNVQSVRPTITPEPESEAIKSPRTDNNRQPLQPVNVQLMQQSVNPLPEKEAIKSPTTGNGVKHDENLLYQSLRMPSNSPDPSRLLTRSPQAHPQPFNPTLNSSPSRISPSLLSPPNTGVRAQSTSPASAAQGVRVTGYEMFRVSVVELLLLRPSCFPALNA